MQPHPGKVAAERVPAVEIARHKGPKGAGKLVVGDPFDIHLQRDVGKHAHNEGHHQPLEALADVLPVAPPAQRIVRAQGGEHEKERHDPLGRHVDKHTQAGAQPVVLGMPVFVVEKPRAVVQENRAQVVLAEAEVPKAMAEAFRKGNLGIMDYYRMKNINADTAMRDSISKPPKDRE